MILLLRIALTLNRRQVYGNLAWQRCMTHVSLMPLIHPNRIASLADHVFIVFLFHLSKDLSLIEVLGRFYRCRLCIFIFNVRWDEMTCLIWSISDHLLFFIIIVNICSIVCM
jgi:hypothetical protein